MKKAITRTFRMLKIQATGVNISTGGTETKTVEMPEPDYCGENVNLALSDDIFKVAISKVIGHRDVKYSMPIKDFVELATEVKGKENNND